MDGKELGVAVASKFLAVGAYVPAAEVGAGALATQAYGNMAIRTEGLKMLKDGMNASEVLEEFFLDDPKKDERQAGIVDARGQAATYTGNLCAPWAGGRADKNAKGSFAVQGNMLAGSGVLDAMVDAWLESYKDSSLAGRLVKALAAGQKAGGDPRGKQSASVLVVAKGRGYGGLSDVAVDLRCDDSSQPIEELERMLILHELYFGSTPEQELLDIDETLSYEIAKLLKASGFASGDIAKDLYAWMSRENFEERWHKGKLDPIVLKQLRTIGN